MFHDHDLKRMTEIELFIYIERSLNVGRIKTIEMEVFLCIYSNCIHFKLLPKYAYAMAAIIM